jgi:hypothetical protein
MTRRTTSRPPVSHSHVKFAGLEVQEVSRHILKVTRRDSSERRKKGAGKKRQPLSVRPVPSRRSLSGQSWGFQSGAHEGPLLHRTTTRFASVAVIGERTGWLWTSQSIACVSFCCRGWPHSGVWLNGQCLSLESQWQRQVLNCI